MDLSQGRWKCPFNWSSQAPDNVLDAIRTLSADALLVPRDPRSHARLSQRGVVTTLGADVVFSLKTPDALPEVVHDLIDGPDPLALLNTSGLIHRKVDLTTDYARVIEHLHTMGYRVVFAPHVIREPDNDLRLAAQLYRSHAAPSDVLIDTLITPAQVKGLVERADVVVTGRMHLAIQALSHGTPAITLSTVGKVEGLYELFRLPELVVDPVPGMATSIVTTLDHVRAHREEVRHRIDQALPNVRRLSRVNFADVPQSSDTAVTI